jgi:hypothetical protein
MQCLDVPQDGSNLFPVDRKQGEKKCGAKRRDRNERDVLRSM